MDYFLFKLWSSIFPLKWSYNSIGSWNNQPLDQFSSTNRPKLSINEQCRLGSDRLLVWLARWMCWIWSCCDSTTTNHTPTSKGYKSIDISILIIEKSILILLKQYIAQNSILAIYCLILGIYCPINKVAIYCHQCQYWYWYCG